MMLLSSLAKKTKQATHTRTIAWPTEGLKEGDRQKWKRGEGSSIKGGNP